MSHFCFWGQESLSDRSISKHYSKSNATPWVWKRPTSRAFQALDTGFYWSLENALHKRFIAERVSGGVESEWKCRSSPLSIENTLRFWVRIQLSMVQIADEIIPSLRAWHRVSLWEHNDVSYRLVMFCSQMLANFYLKTRGVSVNALHRCTFV